MSMEYIRKTYGVPAKRGARVKHLTTSGVLRFGEVKGSCGPYLRIKMLGDKRSGLYHPTWNLVFL